MLGASKGLGKAVALALLAEGAAVTTAAPMRDAIEGWKAELPGDQAARLTVHDLDLFESLLPAGVDVLVNNCGGPAPGGVVGTPSDTWSRAFASMAGAVFQLTDRMIGPTLDRQWGRIIT
ncbi:SDR family NAD(P)-dependent oxidoreductase [Lichenifustis flavocetrariae]|uniref:SDR family NAD(P)-dependent oxidoreductase n=1 Tax=Lichenifustis flavocetrariae TaxID=2949735 RepID=A0AA41Z2L8_9HYPH|nr:SDR family NAD(P)-dependent oxidoreductase [Lichenifustis flavocetrariae]MCW6511670.1 SDR family NAD(P)-dependent oxidoreductase [Lichenifustis flavocetrariae]